MAKAKTPAEQRRELHVQLARLDLDRAASALAILQRKGVVEAIEELRGLWDETEPQTAAVPGQVHVNAEIGYVMQVVPNVTVSLQRAVDALDAVVNPKAAEDPADAAEGAAPASVPAQ